MADMVEALAAASRAAALGHPPGTPLGGAEPAGGVPAFWALLSRGRL